MSYGESTGTKSKIAHYYHNVERNSLTNSLTIDKS